MGGDKRGQDPANEPTPENAIDIRCHLFWKLVVNFGFRTIATAAKGLLTKPPVVEPLFFTFECVT